MQEIAELERRITFALERVSKGLAQLTLPSPKVPMNTTVGADDQTAALRTELDEERTVTAQLQERLRAIKEKEVLALEALQSQLAALDDQNHGAPKAEKNGRMLCWSSFQ